MPRTKKPVAIYKKTGKPFRTDMDLVIAAQKGEENAYVELWDKFFLLRQKEKFSFIRWCQTHKISNYVYQDYVDSWEADAWEKFRNQMAGIRIDELKSKGYTPEKWGITIRLQGYFEVVNRSYSNRILKRLNNEMPNVAFYKDGDDEGVNIIEEVLSSEDDGLRSYAKKILRESYKNMLKDLDTKQRKIITMKSENKSISSIVCDLEIKRNDVSKALKTAKERLEYWIEKASKADGVPMTYNDLVEYV